MGWAKNRDCEECGEWVGQCGCDEPWHMEPDLPDDPQQCSDYFASLGTEEIDQIPF